MTREILFRGLRTGGKGWALGSLVTTTDYIKHMPKQHTKTWIVTRAFGNGGWFNIRNRFCVRPETVGQYVGMEGKNGKMIFEGDILKEDDHMFTVVWCSEWAEFKLQHGNVIQYPGWNRGKDMEKVGNIHENPELLEG